MTSLAIAKLVSDALIFVSLIFLSFRVLKKQPSTGANLVKLKELELALKEVVKQADEASQNFNDELLTRKRDLERVLSEAQGIEVRLNKSENVLNESIREAELTRRDLESASHKSSQEFNQLRNSISRSNDQVESWQNKEEPTLFLQQPQPSRSTLFTEEPRPASHQEAHQTNIQEKSIAQPKINSRISRGEEIVPAIPLPNFEYSKMLEPPSFSQISAVTEKRVAPRALQNSALSQQIEKTRDYSSPNDLAHSRNNLPLEDSLRSVATSAERSIEATRLPEHLEEALATAEQSAPKLTREDPRLGVLGGIKRTSHVV